MEPKFVTWDDLFNADYLDLRYRKIVTIRQATKKYEEDMLLESKLN